MSNEDGGFNIIEMSEPFQARAFHQRIKQARDELIEHAGLGHCQSWDQYQRHRGKIEGLKLALDICADIADEKDIHAR